MFIETMLVLIVLSLCGGLLTLAQRNNKLGGEVDSQLKSLRTQDRSEEKNFRAEISKRLDILSERTSKIEKKIVVTDFFKEEEFLSPFDDRGVDYLRKRLDIALAHSWEISTFDSVSFRILCQIDSLIGKDFLVEKKFTSQENSKKYAKRIEIYEREAKDFDKDMAHLKSKYTK